MLSVFWYFLNTFTGIIIKYGKQSIDFGLSYLNSKVLFSEEPNINMVFCVTFLTGVVVGICGR